MKKPICNKGTAAAGKKKCKKCGVLHRVARAIEKAAETTAEAAGNILAKGAQLGGDE